MSAYRSSKTISLFLTIALLALSGCQAKSADFSAHSKYSPKHREFISSGNPDDQPKNPNPELYNQHDYIYSHELRLDPVAETSDEFLTLNKWRNMYEAGKLAIEHLDYDEANKMFKMAVEQAQNEDDRDKKICYAMLRLGYIARTQKQYEQAEKYNKDSLILSREIKTDNGNALLSNLDELVLLKTRTGSYIEAEPYLVEALAATKQNYGAFSEETASALNELGDCYYYQRKFDQAEPYYYKAAVINSHLADLDPDKDYHNYALHNLANCALFAGKYADAQELYKEVMKVSGQNYDAQIAYCAKELIEHPGPRTIFFKANGDAKLWQEFLDDAKEDIAQEHSWQSVRDLQAALKEAEGFGKEDRRYLNTLITLANAEASGNQNEGATKHYDQIASVLRQHPNILSNLDLIDIELGMIKINLAQREDTEVLKHLDLALMLTCKAGPQGMEKLNETVLTILEHHQLEKPELASAFLHSLVEQNKLVCGTDSPQYASALYALAKTENSRQASAEKEKLYKLALAIAEKSLKADDTKIADIAFDLGCFYQFDRRYADAEAPLLKNLEIRKLHPGVRQSDLRRAFDQLKYLYINWSKPEEQERMLLEMDKLLLSSEDDPWLPLHLRQRLLEKLQISRDKGDFEQAENYAEQNYAQIEKLSNKNNQDIMAAIKELINIYSFTSNYEKLAECNERMADIEAVEYGKLSGEYGKFAGDGARQCAGISYARAGNYEKAIPILEALVSKLEREGKTQPSYGCYETLPNYSACTHNLANCYLDGSDKYNEALANYKKAYQMLPESLVSNPLNKGEAQSNNSKSKILSYHLIHQTFNIALCLDAMGKYDEAAIKHKSIAEAILQAPGRRDDINKLLEHYSQLALKPKRNREETVELMKTFANLLHDPKHSTGGLEGLEYLLRVLAMDSHKYGQTSAKLIDDLVLIAKLYDESWQQQETEKIQNRLLYIEQSNKSTSPAQWCDALVNQANTYYKGSNFLRGRDYYLKALPLVEKQYGKNSIEYALTEKHLGECYFAIDEISSAEKCFLEAAQLLAAKKDNSNKELLNTFMRLAVIYDVTDNSKKADSYYQKGLSTETDYKNEAFTSLEPLTWAAEHFAETKQYDLASLIHKRNIAILKNNSADASTLALAWEQMARMYKNAGQWKDSADAYSQAIACIKLPTKNLYDCDRLIMPLQEYCDVLAKANNSSELKRAQSELQEITQLRDKRFKEFQAQHPSEYPKKRPIGLD